MDPRVKKLADVLLNYSVKLKKGQWLKIQGEVATLPLITEVYEQAIKLGANPFVQVIVPEAQEAFLKYATEEQMKFIAPNLKLEVDRIDALVHIWGGTNTRNLSRIDPKRQAKAQQYRRPLSEKLMKRIGNKDLSWVGTLYPTHSSAQDADMSLTDYEDFVYRAGHVHAGDPVKHWKKIEKEQNRLVKILNQIDQLHILSNDTDLKMRVKGRKWINCCGTENFPDGEIFTAPLETSVEGHIRYSFPAVYGGREVEDVRLEFKKGKVIKETAAKNEAFLTSMLNMDKGARFVGEVAIGTNYEIKRFSRNILFDEKIGGTCHLAVGASIPESGGKNKSALHWDMICDLKKDSEITADGKVIYRNGKFTI
jgi:aminopeptidase